MWAALLSALGGAACRREAPPPDAAAAPAGARVRVVVESPSGRTSAVVAEVARTDADRARGLMFRERLGADEGMIFLFDEEAEHAFWMRNTLVPLDLIFVDARGLVTGVIEGARPGSLEPRSAGPSRWVLEVNAGWAAAHGVRAGDRVSLHELPR